MKKIITYEYLVALVVLLSLCITVCLWIVYMQDSIIVQREYDLNVSQTAFKIQKSTLERVADENQMLRQANECLITYSYRDRCITAIKHTPLPPLEMK